MRKVTDIFRKKLVVFALIIASVFAGVASPIAVSTANVEETKATELFPVDFRTILGSDMGWIDEITCPMLDDVEIKLYKLSTDKMTEIIGRHNYPGGKSIYTANEIGIWDDFIAEGLLVSAWKASENNNIVYLPGGDYFFTVSETLTGYGKKTPFNVSEDGKEIKRYNEYYNSDFETTETIYKEGSIGETRSIDVGISSSDLLVKYVDPEVAIYDSEGNNRTDECEIDFYKKDDSSLTLNSTTGRYVDLYWAKPDLGKTSIRAALEHPGTHVIRCVSVPEGYKKFDDVTLNITRRNDGWPDVSIDEQSPDNAKAMFSNGFYGHRLGTSFVAKITLEKAEDILPENITINKTELVLDKEKATETLTTTVSPENADDKTVTWSSSDESVAKVDKNTGKVTAVKAGTATITAETVNGKTAACKVTVKSSAIETITINKTEIELARGKSETLTAIVSSENDYDKTVTWSSSDPNVATVDKNTGKVTAVKAGTATITAETVNGKTAECKVTVKPSAIMPEKITINKNEIELSKGKSEILTTTISPENAYDKSVTWSSSDTSVAEVGKNNGKVKAVKAGSATITAKTVNGKTATCKVTVKGFVPGIDGNSFVHTNEFTVYKNAGFAGRENRQFFVGKQKTDYNDYHNRLIEVITKTDNLRNTLENMYKVWHGSCFGISAVMGLKYRNKIDSECIANNTDTMFFDVDWPCNNIKMDNYINFYQLLQYEFLSHPELSKHIATWWFELDSINPLDNCYATGDFLIEVVNSIKSGKTLLLNTDSHSVLLPGTYEEDENSYQIDLFDCNTVNDNNTIGTMSKFIINKDYKDFSIELASGVITDDNHGSLSIIDIDDLPILNIDNNTVDNVKWTYDDLYQLQIDPSNKFTFINDKGELIPDENTIKGNLKVYYISPSGYCDSLNNTPTENKYYTLKIDQSSEYIITDIEKNIDISIGDAENSYSIKGSGIEEIRITPNEGLTIKGDVMSYKVMLNTKDKINENEKGIIEIEGKGKKEVKFTQQKDTILVDSEEDCENVSITSYLTFEPYVQFENRTGNHFVANSGTEPGSKYVQVKEVTIPEQKIELGINESYRLQPNIEPDNSTNKKIKYISSDNNIVTVDKDGNIKAVGEGEAVIQIISEDSGVKTECSVVVKKGNKNIQKTDNKKSNEVTENQVSKPSAASNSSSVKKVVSSSGIAKKAGTSAGVVTQASKTGDNNLTALWITLSAVSAGIAGAIIALIKRRRTE